MFAMMAIMTGVTLGILGTFCIVDAFLKPLIPYFAVQYYLILLQDERGSWEVKQELDEITCKVFQDLFEGDPSVSFAKITEFSTGFYTYELDI